MNIELESLNQEKEKLESDLHTIEYWNEIKSSLKNQFRLSDDAFNSLKKPDAEVLTQNDFNSFQNMYD